MKLLFEFLPIAAFFLAYKLFDIYTATLVAILISGLQLIYSRYQSGHFEKLPTLTFAILTVLGSATLFLHNELFIKLKPTALYWIFALSLILSQLTKTTLLERMLGKNLALAPAIWQRLNIAWALFFLNMGALNIYVLYHYDTQTWVNFKLFGTLILTLIFVLAQGLYISRHLTLVKCNEHPQ